MLRQVFILLCGVALTLALGDGRPFQSKKNTFQKQSKFASVTSYHSSQPAVAPIKSAASGQAAPARAAPAQAAPSPYSFGYEAEGSARQESADASGKVTGSYKVINEDGTVRIVNYVADEQGFRADVDTNEPGTKSSNPSNVALKSAFVEPPAPAAPMRYATKSSADSKATKSRFEQKPAQFNMDSGAYSYNYEAQLEDGGSIGRSEIADGSGSVTGHYSMSAADGRRRQVDYSSGSQGFQAKIDTNELGTKSESPAQVQFYSSAPQQQSAPAPSPYSSSSQQQQSAPAPSPYSSSHQQQQQVSSYSLMPARQEPIRASPQKFSQQSIQQEAVQYDNKPSPYSFSYDAQMEDGSSSRSESSDGSGKVVGSYSLMTADGRQRTINYEADHAGFRAKVNTNEFGTQSDSPADAEFYSSAKAEAPSAPVFQNAGQQKISAAFPVQQSPLRSSAQTKSIFQPQASSSGTQFKSSFQDQQSAVQYNAGSDSYSPYAFNYLAELDDGTSSRSESADGSGKVVGSYSLSVDDGRKRTVDYLADQGGFRASINTNEYGTKSDSPADVQFYSSAVQEEAAPAPQTYSAKSSSSFSSQMASKPAPVSQVPYHSSGSPSFRQSPLSQQQAESEPSYQPSPYAFNYEAEATGGSSARNEASDASGTVTGSYTVRNEDGSVRVVEYIADKNGFRANVKTNEPGTKSDDPADVLMKSDAPLDAPSAPVRQSMPQSQPRQQQQQVSKANFPARSSTQKSSMISQRNIDPWRR